MRNLSNIHLAVCGWVFTFGLSWLFITNQVDVTIMSIVIWVVFLFVSIFSSVWKSPIDRDRDDDRDKYRNKR